MGENFLAPSRLGSSNGKAITGESERKTFTGSVLSVQGSLKKYNIDTSSPVLDLNTDDIVEITGCSNTENNGLFKIISVDKDNNALKLNNLSAVDELGSSGTITFTYTIRLLHVIGV